MSTQVNTNGDVMNNIKTRTLQYLNMYAYSNVFSKNINLNNGMQFWSKYMNVGDGKFYIYFYNTNGNGLKNGDIPDFLNYDLTINEDMLVAYASDASDVNESKKKQGILKYFTGELGSEFGIVFKFPAGYGTGEINAFCVTPIDLATLRTTSNKVNQSTIIRREISSVKDYAWIKPNIPGITLENEILLLDAYSGMWKVNLKTGERKSCNGENPVTYETAPNFGQQMYLIDGYLYFFKYESRYFLHLMKVDISNWSTTEITNVKAKITNNTQTIIDANNVLYVQNSVENNAIQFDTYNLSTNEFTEKSVTFNIPEFLQEHKSDLYFTGFADGTFGLGDSTNGYIWQFRDLQDFTGSIVKFYSIGFYYAYGFAPFEYNNTMQFACTSRDVNSNYTINYTINEGIPLVLTYNKFDNSFTKSEDADFTNRIILTQL